MTGRNERLRAALDANGMTQLTLATRVDVDPKTVERWIVQGRTPYPRIGHQVARVLDVEVTYLWPDLYARRAQTPAAQDELIACHPGRAAVPAGLATRIISEARRHVDIMGDPSIVEAIADLPDLLADRAAAGVTVRIILPDLDTLTPGEATRTRNVEMALRPLLGTPGISIGRHVGPLVTTILRGDDDLLVRTALDGAPAGFAPVLHLRHLPGGTLATVYLTSLACVAENTLPLTAATVLRAVS